MKATFNRKFMLDAFGAVASVAPGRSPKPILQNLKLTADGNANAVLMATDLEVGISYSVLGVSVETPGSVILPTGRFGQILRASNDDELVVLATGDDLVVRGKRSEFKLPTEDPAAFPEVPEFSATNYHVVAAADLGKMIRRTMFACDVESTRYALGGVLVELTADSIAMVGTDGRRLARMIAPAETEGEAEPPTGSPVIPVKALKLIERTLDDDDPPVHIAFPSAGAVLVRSERAVIYSRLVEGRFPRYQDVFPAEAVARIPLRLSDFRAAVSQAQVTTSDESRGVDFNFATGTVTLKAVAADVGSSQVELPIDHEGTPIEITFDGRYVTDVLKVVGDAEDLTLDLIDAKNAAVFRVGESYSVVVMPLTR